MEGAASLTYKWPFPRGQVARTSQHHWSIWTSTIIVHMSNEWLTLDTHPVFEWAVVKYARQRLGKAVGDDGRREKRANETLDRLWAGLNTVESIQTQLMNHSDFGHGMSRQKRSLARLGTLISLITDLKSTLKQTLDLYVVLTRFINMF